MVSGHVFSVERYAIHDGPGIRTQVFFKGCPLRCLWCSNPEGRSFVPHLIHTPSLCIRCAACVAACEHNALSLTEDGLVIDCRDCTLCGECASLCYAEALELSGWWLTADEVMAEVERDRSFYQVSGRGGITLCGGEPLAQPEFALELLQSSKARGLHTAIETCGHYPFDALEKALPFLDYVFFDLKHLDARAHRDLTGAGNELILDNLRRLQAFEVDLCIRVPVIPTLNDDHETLEAMARFVAELPRVQLVELLPYHRLGVNKYKKLGIDYLIDHIQPPGKDEIRKLATVFQAHGVACKGG